MQDRLCHAHNPTVYEKFCIEQFISLAKFLRIAQSFNGEYRNIPTLHRLES
jgi:hypothetical protein